MKLDLRDSYASYQLNNSELVRLARAPQDQLQKLHDQFCQSDTREDYTPQELEAALQSLGLAQHRSQLESKKEAWSPLECGVYRRLGLPQYDPAPAEAANCPTLAQAGLQLFARLDRNQDGRLSPRELEAALVSDEYQGHEAAALVMLHCEQELLKDCVRDGAGITRADLEHLRDKGVDGQNARLGTGLAAREALADALGPPLPLMQESFDPASLRQAKSGTCASLAILHGQKPEQVRGMFNDHGDGTVTVTLKDGSRHHLKDVSMAERLYQASAGQGERWPALLELALGSRLAQLGKPHKFDDLSARSHIALGQPYELGFRLLTGAPCRRIDIGLRSPQRCREELQQALTQGTVVAGSRDGVKNGVVGHHAYRITGYDPQRDVVSLRNPWRKGEWAGCQDGQDDGSFEMPFLQFYASYSQLAVTARDNALKQALFSAGQALSVFFTKIERWLSF
ncbi:MAG: C2 family cysteine protease [Vulcanimicrobiota bacterium]